VHFQVGWRHYDGWARPLPAAESGHQLSEYARRHPRTAAALMRAIGHDIDGSAAAYERVGSDPKHGVPIVVLAPGDHDVLAPHVLLCFGALPLSAIDPRQPCPLWIWLDAVRIEGEKPAWCRRERQGGTQMKQYLLSVYQPDGFIPPPEVLEKVMHEVDALNQELKAAGAWVFGGGLHPPNTATVVRLQDGDVLTTDGPFAEGKEHIGGFVIIKAPDLDAALEWGRKATRATTLPIEVRPFQDEAGN
jgi:hypothetical protein